MKEKQLSRYLFWAFALAWALQAVAIVFARRGEVQGFRLVLALSMYAPFAAVLFSGIGLYGMGWKPALRGKVKYLLAAWFGAAVLALLGGALYYLLFPAQLDLSAGGYFASLSEQGVPQAELERVGTKTLLLVQIASSLIYAPFLNMLFAVGEEAGWRGALYPMLKERAGVAKGRLLGGLIWGVWHWPVMILAGYNYGTEYWGAPVTGPLLFCFVTFCLGVLFDWLYEKTRCIWIPALAHGAYNAVAGMPILFLAAGAAPSSLLGPTLGGLIAGLPMILLGLLLWRKSDAQAA